MALFHLKVRDRASKKESQITVNGDHTAESAKDHIEKMPGSRGGTHPGFDVLEVKDAEGNVVLPKPEAPAQPAA